jgi:[acyl-carrier-protein] S-malonyltransferase
MSLALIFSPQGSQVVGMGRELAEASAAARSVYARADAALGWDVTGLCWEGPAEALDDTRQTQPCLVATSLACLAALAERTDLRPSFAAGHSVGEYAALAAVGAVSHDDALRLVARRGQLMADQSTAGGMLAVIGLDREPIALQIATFASPAELVVANDNAPGQVVVSGARAALDAAEEPLRSAGAKRLVRLRVSGAFHSPMMAPVSEALAAALDSVPWAEPAMPVISNVTAEPVADAARLRNLLAEQARSPVEWVASVRRMAEEGVTTFVECGPGSALTGMVRRILPDARTLNVSDVPSLEATLHELAARPATAGTVS